MADKPDVQSGPKDRAEVSTLLARTMIGTTWRMFVPSIGCLIVGLLLDGMYHTTPWLLLIGFLIGLMVSALLVRGQIRQLKTEGESK